MAKEDAAIAELATGLNEDAKADRKRRKAEPPAEGQPPQTYTRSAKTPANPARGDAWEDDRGKVRYSYGAEQGWYLSPPDGFVTLEADRIPDVDEINRGDARPEPDDQPEEAEVTIDELEDAPEEQTEAETEDVQTSTAEPEREVAVADASGPATLDESDDTEHPGAARIEQAAEDFNPDPESAIQGLRDFILTAIRQVDKPYHLMSEAAQVDIIRAAEYGAEEAVRRVIEMVAARGQKPVRVLLKKITAGDKIQITGEVSLIGPDNPDDSLLLLHHAIGKHVMLTRATVDDYKNGPAAEPDPEEPEIDFESEDLSDDEDADEDSAT